MAEEWVWSTNEEEFYMNPHDSREAAVEEGTGECEACEDSSFYVGRVVSLKLSDLSIKSGERVIDDCIERAFERVGEAQENWADSIKPDEIKDLDNRIRELLDRWADDHKNHPSFFAVEDVEQILVTLPEEVAE